MDGAHSNKTMVEVQLNNREIMSSFPYFATKIRQNHS